MPGENDGDPGNPAIDAGPNIATPARVAVESTTLGQYLTGIAQPLYTPEPAGTRGSPLLNVSNPSHEDLYQENLDFLSNYAGLITSDNPYPLNQNVTNSPIDGEPPTDRTDAGQPENVFLGDILDASYNYFELMNSGAPGARQGGMFTNQVIRDFLDKSAEDGNKSGNTLLSDIKGEVNSNTWVPTPYNPEGETPQATQVRAAVQTTLALTNRWDPPSTSADPVSSESPYIEDGAYTHGSWTLQGALGAYTKNQAEEVTFENLAKVGLSLMLASAGGHASGSPNIEDPGDVDATDVIGDAMIQLQLDRADTADLTNAGERLRQFTGATSAHGSMPFGLTGENAEGERRVGSEVEVLEADSRNSYGVLNSYLEPFDGPLPVAMLVLAVLAAITVLIAGALLALVLDLIFKFFPPADDESGNYPLPLGASKGWPDYGDISMIQSMGAWMRRYLRIPNLKSGTSFFEAMMYGTMEFYWNLLGMSAGYYIGVSRAAIRDAEQIGDALANFDTSSLVGIIEGIFLVVDAFSTSTTFQFLNTMAKIGDIVVMSGGSDGTGPLTFSPYMTKQNPDQSAPVLANLHTKGRLKAAGADSAPKGAGDDYRRADRHGALPSRYLLPTAIRKSIMLSKNNAPYLSEPVFDKLGDKAGFANAVEGGQTFNADPAEKNSKFAPSQISGRLPTEFVREVENMLETTYMPFYFHDLRTNEIISFHAFVENISDSFSPQWNEVGGFGRMDSVQIYNSTQRSISLDFWIAAMDRSDFDEVWFAINRLVMLVYPQWSRGDQKADGTLDALGASNFFIQPFSQIPTASPLIRMRLGELFKSNFSVHNLKRLFGLMSNSFSLKDQDSDARDRMDKVVEIQAELAKIMARKTESNYPDANAAVAAMAGDLKLADYVDTGGGFKYKDQVTLKRGTYVCAQGDATGFRPKHLKTTITVESSITGRVIGFIVSPILPTDNKKLTSSKRGRIPRVVKYVVGDPEDAKKVALKNLLKVVTDNDADVKGVIVDRSDLDFDMEWETKKAMTAVFGDPPSALDKAMGVLPEEVTFDDITGTAVSDFFAGNPIIRSFQEAGGSGLAGVITSMNFDWNTAPWELDQDARAPTAVKVSLGFTPIHDIPLGLDADGVMRAAAYPVGQVMASLMGSPSSEYGDLASALKQKILKAKSDPAKQGASKVEPPAKKPGEK